MLDDDTRAKLAIIKIWRGKNPKEHLLEIYPKCSLVGQAYVLAALWHFDRDAFRRLAADFARHQGPIETMVADIGSSESPSKLLEYMQETNCSLAFSDPPLTRKEIGRLIEADDRAHYKAFERTDEWKKAETKYRLGTPDEAMVGWTVELTPKTSKMPFTIDWGWEQSNNVWSPTVSIGDITEVIHEIEETPFIRAVNDRTPLDIYLEAVSGNFHERETKDASDPQGEEASFDIALVKAAGYSGTNRLVKVLARSNTGPLTLWHPEHSSFWLITWNLKISPEWREVYKKQTGLELTEMETASGWAATCDNAGALKMVRCPQAKTIDERVRESFNQPGGSK